MKKYQRLLLALSIIAAVAAYDLTVYDGTVKDLGFVMTNGVRGVAILLAAYLAFVPAARSDRKTNTLSYAVIALAGTVLIAGYISPRFVADLAAEDYLVENLSAAFLLLGSLVLLGTGLLQLAGRNWFISTLVLLMAAVFFVMGMEEISWMQRIVERETTGFFAEHNQQGETNLHNLNAVVSNLLFAIGGFVLLTALPYYRTQVAAWLDRRGWAKLQPFLPDGWLLLPFAVAVGFGFPSAHVSVPILLILFFTLLMLLSRRHYALLLFIVVAFLSTALHKGIYTGYVNAYQEYRELFITLGCLVYAAGVARKLAGVMPAGRAWFWGPVFATLPIRRTRPDSRRSSRRLPR